MPQDQNEILLTRFEETLTLSALSSSTIVNYLADVRAFLRWGQTETGDQFSVSRVTQEHIRLYRYYLAQEMQRAASTVNRHLMALKKFFAFVLQRGDIPLDPTSGVSLVQDNGQAASRCLAAAEINLLLQAAQNGSRAGLIRRDLAILNLMLYSGLRVSEIVDLKKDDMVFDHPGVRLKVCSGPAEAAVRYLPLPAEVCKVLHDYLAVRPQRSNTDHFFLSQDGRSISGRTVQRIVSTCARVAGLEGVSAQSLRRTFAVQLFTETQDLDLVSERLGHQNKAITEQFLSIFANN
ncbi:MAG: tyrosine-type recombinase/integrase [Chloroflexota bacterium]